MNAGALEMNNYIRFPLFFAFTVIFGNQLWCTETTEAKIYHRENEGGIRVLHEGIDYTNSEKGEVELKVKNGSKVRLVIGDPNTLLFEYSKGEIKVENSPGYLAAQNLSEIFRSFLGLSEVPEVARQQSLTIEKIVIGGVELDGGKFEGVKELADISIGLSELIDKSRNFVLKESDYSVKNAAEKVGEVSRIIEFIDAIDRQDFADSKVQSIIVYKKNKPPESISVDYLNQGTTEFYLIVVKLKKHREKLSKMITLVEGFNEDFTKYLASVDKGVFLAFVESDNRKVVTQPFSVKSRKASKDEKTVSYVEAYSGDYALVLAAKQSFHLRVGAGVVYSFVENPVYSVETLEEGGVRILQESSEYHELTGAVTFNLYPDRFFGEGISPFGQIGISPIEDSKALMVGIGFRAYDKISMSFGAIHQERRTLEGGKLVGDLLEKAEDLNIGQEYETGVYMQVGFDF